MIYIGVHKQYGLEFDGYLGSGKWFKRSIKYHGESNFTREILYSSAEEELAYFIEENIVTKEFISRDSNYNLKVGGKGGWDHSIDTIEKAKLTRKLNGTDQAEWCNTEEAKGKRNATCIERYGNRMGQCHSKDAVMKAQNTRLSRYGSKIGNLHSKESREKAKLTRELRGNATSHFQTLKSREKNKVSNLETTYKKHPELSIKCKLVKDGISIIEGDVYEVSKYIHGINNASGHRSRILSKLDKNKTFRGSMKGHYIQSISEN
jgi:hypothetical protein